MPIHLSEDDLRRHPHLAARVRETLGDLPATEPDPEPLAVTRATLRRADRRPHQVQQSTRRRLLGRWALAPLAIVAVALGWYGAALAAAAVGLETPRAPAATGEADRSPETPADTDDPPAGEQPAPQPVLAVAAPESPIRVEVNGQTLPFDVPPIIQDGRTLAPLRAIFEALGASVQWDGETQTVIATRPGSAIRLSLGNMWGTVNGSRVPLDVPAMIVNGRTLVPLRFVSEALGARVEWQGETRTVRIWQGQVIQTGAGQQLVRSEVRTPEFSYPCTAIPRQGAGWTRNAQECAAILEAEGRHIAPPIIGFDEGWEYYTRLIPSNGVEWNQVQSRLVGNEIRVCWPDTGMGPAIIDGILKALAGAGDWQCAAFSVDGRGGGWVSVDSPEHYWGCPPPMQGTVSAVGNRISVQIQISGPKGSETAWAIIDTGAAQTTLPDWLLRKVGYTPYLGPISVSGVGSTPSQGYLYRIPYPRMLVDGYGWRRLGEGTLTVTGLQQAQFNQPLIGPDALKAGSTLTVTGGVWTLRLPCL